MATGRALPPSPAAPRGETNPLLFSLRILLWGIPLAVALFWGQRWLLHQDPPIRRFAAQLREAAAKDLICPADQVTVVPDGDKHAWVQSEYASGTAPAPRPSAPAPQI
jgi:hypothetical protein